MAKTKTIKQVCQVLGILCIIIIFLGFFGLVLFFDIQEQQRQAQYISYFQKNPPTLFVNEVTYSNLKIDDEVNNSPYLANYEVSFKRQRNNTFDPFNRNTVNNWDEVILIYTERFPGYGLYESTQIRIKCNLTFQNNYSFQYVYETTNLKNIPQPEILSFSLEAEFTFWVNASQVKEALGFR